MFEILYFWSKTNLSKSKQSLKPLNSELNATINTKIKTKKLVRYYNIEFHKIE